MKTNLMIATVALTTALSAPVMAEEKKSPIVGAWQMASLEIAAADGAYSKIPYSGQVIFTESGTLSVQAANANRNAEDTTYTLQGYESYYGPVVVDDKAGTFTITVASSLVRALEGQSLVRKFDVTDDKLVITPVDASKVGELPTTASNRPAGRQSLGSGALHHMIADTKERT